MKTRRRSRRRRREQEVNQEKETNPNSPQQAILDPATARRAAQATNKPMLDDMSKICAVS